MRPVQRTMVLTLIVFLVGVFVLFTYFYWQPDSLISFVPENAFFYLHLDLNRLRWSGYQGNQWVNSQWFSQTLKDFSQSDSDLALIGKGLQKENIPLLDEVGLVGLPRTKSMLQFNNFNPGVDSEPQAQDLAEGLLSKGNIDIILFLKTKKWADPSLLIKSLEQFFVKELDNHVWAVSYNPFSVERKQSGDFLTKDQSIKEKILSSISDLSIWGQGYINFEQLVNFLKGGKDVNWSKGGFARISILSSPPDSLRDSKWADRQELQNLFFKLDLPPTQSMHFDDYLNSKIRLAFQTRDWIGGGLNFAFIFPQSRSLDLLENKIKVDLSLQWPIEKQVFLPDGSSFTELIADPDIFNFESKKVEGVQLRHWQDNFSLEREGEEIFEILLWQDEKYTFASNSLSLFERLIKNTGSCFQDESLEKGIYFKVENLGIKDLVIIETSEGIEGCIELEG